MFFEKKKKKLFTVLVGQYRKIFDLNLFETAGKYFSIRTSKHVNNIYVYYFHKEVYNK